MNKEHNNMVLWHFFLAICVTNMLASPPPENMDPRDREANDIPHTCVVGDERTPGALALAPNDRMLTGIDNAAHPNGARYSHGTLFNG